MRDTLTVTPMEPRMIVTENVIAKRRSRCPHCSRKSKALATLHGAPEPEKAKLKTIEEIGDLNGAERTCVR
jgi:hypothetical protein